jgi:hypothetical protein
VTDHVIEGATDANGSVFDPDLYGHAASDAAECLSRHWARCQPALPADTKANDIQAVIDILVRWQRRVRLGEIPVLAFPLDYANRDRMQLAFRCSYPWVRATTVVRPSVETAYADAQAWAQTYVAEVSYARMASALGVAARPGGYVGVVNYYHSNS